jgi:hypothetical protein
VKPIKFAIIAALACVGLAGAGTQLVAAGEAQGRDLIAQGDPPPLPDAFTDAARDRGDVATAPPAVEPLPVPCIDPDGLKAPLPCGPVPDVLEQPAEAFSLVRTFFGDGYFVGAVVLLLVLASAVYVRMRPADKDGDGKPDPEGWRGRTWVISGAVLLVGGALLAKLTGVGGARWGAVRAAAGAAAALLLPNLNPKRGAARVGA